jgi:hypothetical protein
MRSRCSGCSSSPRASGSLGSTDHWGRGVLRFLHRTEVTVVGGVLIAAVTVLGLLRVRWHIAELV